MVDLSRRKKPLGTPGEHVTASQNGSHALFTLDTDHSNQLVLDTGCNHNKQLNAVKYRV